MSLMTAVLVVGSLLVASLLLKVAFYGITAQWSIFLP